MPLSLGVVEARVTLDLKGLREGVGKAQSEFTRLNNYMSNRLNLMGGQAAKAATNIGGKLYAGLAQGVGRSKQVLGQLGGISNSFGTTLTGLARQVDNAGGQMSRSFGKLRSDFSTTANQVVTDTSTINRSFFNLGNAIKTGLGVAGGLAIAGVASAGLGALKNSVIGLNASLEQSKVAFATQLQGMARQRGLTLEYADALKLADQKVQALYNYASSTPFEFPGVVEAARLLQTFGITSDEMLKKVGDAASGIGGTAEQLKQVSFWVGRLKQDATKGEAIQNLTQLGVLSQTDLKLKGIRFGKSGAVMAEDVSKVFDAATKVIEDKFAGSADKISQTFNGKMSTLKDNLSQTFATAGAPIFDQLAKPAMDKLIAITGSPEFKATTTRIATGLAEAIKQGFAIGAQVAAVAGQGFDLLGRVIGSVGDMAARTGAAFTSLSAPLGNLASHFFGMDTTSRLLQTTLFGLADGATVIGRVFGGNLTGAVALARTSLADFGVSLPNVSGALAALTTATGGFFNADFAAKFVAIGTAVAGVIPIIRTASTVFGLLGSALGLLVSPIGLVVGAVAGLAAAWQFVERMGGVGPALQAVGQIFGQLATNVGTFVGQALSQLASLAQQAPAFLAELARQFGTWLGAALPGIAQQVGQYGSVLIGQIGQLAGAVGGALLQLAAKFGTWLYNAIPQIGTAVGQFGAFLIARVIDVASMVVPALGTLASNFLGWLFRDVLPKLPVLLLDFGGRLVAGIGNAITWIVPRLAELAGKFVGWLLSAIIQLPQKMLEWGGALVSGIINNLPQIIGALGKLVLEFGGFVLKAIPTMIVAVGKFFVAMLEEVWKGLTAVGSAIGDFFKNAWNWVSDGWANLTGATETGAQNVADAAKTGLDDASATANSFATTITNVANGLNTTFTWLDNQTAAGLSNYLGKIDAFVNALRAAAAEVAKTLPVFGSAVGGVLGGSAWVADQVGKGAYKSAPLGAQQGAANQRNAGADERENQRLGGGAPPSSKGGGITGRDNARETTDQATMNSAAATARLIGQQRRALEASKPPIAQSYKDYADWMGKLGAPIGNAGADGLDKAGKKIGKSAKDTATQIQVAIRDLPQALLGNASLVSGIANSLTSTEALATLSTASETIKGRLTQMLDMGQIGAGNLTPMLLARTADVGKVIAEVERTGKVTDAQINTIKSSLASLGPATANAVVAQVQLQANLQQQAVIQEKIKANQAEQVAIQDKIAANEAARKTALEPVNAALGIANQHLAEQQAKADKLKQDAEGYRMMEQGVQREIDASTAALEKQKRVQAEVLAGVNAEYDKRREVADAALAAVNGPLKAMQQEMNKVEAGFANRKLAVSEQGGLTPEQKAAQIAAIDEEAKRYADSQKYKLEAARANATVAQDEYQNELDRIKTEQDATINKITAEQTAQNAADQERINSLAMQKEAWTNLAAQAEYDYSVQMINVNTAQNAVDDLNTKIKDINAVHDATKTKLEDQLTTLGSLKTALDSQLTSLKDQAAPLEQAIQLANARKLAEDKVVASLKDQAGYIENIVNTDAAKMKTKTKPAGEAAGDGIVEGVNSRGDAAYKAGEYLGERTTTGYKDKMQIKSPSQVMMAAGEQTADGLRDGIMKRLGLVADAGSRMGAAVTDGVADVPKQVEAAVDQASEGYRKLQELAARAGRSLGFGGAPSAVGITTMPVGGNPSVLGGGAVAGAPAAAITIPGFASIPAIPGGGGPPPSVPTPATAAASSAVAGSNAAAVAGSNAAAVAGATSALRGEVVLRVISDAPTRTEVVSISDDRIKIALTDYTAGATGQPASSGGSTPAPAPTPRAGGGPL